MRLLILVVSALQLASCGEPPIQCDAEGKIIINPAASQKLQDDWSSRNLQLALRRLDDATGMSSPPDYLRGSLSKAEGCP